MSGAWPLCLLAASLVGCGGRLSANPADDSPTTQSPPPVIVATCASAPPELPLAPFQGQLQAIETPPLLHWSVSWRVVGGQGEQVFVKACGGDGHSSGCKYEVLNAAEPAHEPLPSGDGRGLNSYWAAWSNATEVLYPPNQYFGGTEWSPAALLTDNHEFSEVTGASTRDFWLKEAVPVYRPSDDGAIYRVVDGVATAVPLADLPGQTSSPGHVSRIQAGDGEELWGIQASYHTQKGELLHLAAGSWSRTGLVDIEAIFVPSDHSVWAVGGDSIHRFANGCWVSWLDPRTLSGVAPGKLQRVWASSATDAWVTGDDNLLRHWDGVAWSLAPIGEGSSRSLLDVWGTPSGIWVFLAPGDPTASDSAALFLTTLANGLPR